jgi:type IV pilus assembly protein PilV
MTLPMTVPMSRRPLPPARQRRRGIALLEALVALLLLSFAALGYAGLQMRGLGANSSALWRSKASLLAYDMTDRLRANRQGVTDGRYDLLWGSPSAPGCGSGSACTPANMARLDHAQWADALADELPGGAGAVCLDSTPDDGNATAPACDGAGSMLAVKVFWREKGVDTRLVLAVRP